MLINQDFIDRVLHIEKLAHQWVSLETEHITEINRAYVSLMFAFPLARFQQESLVLEHLQQANEVLLAKRDCKSSRRAEDGTVDEIHKYLLDVFRFRIEQALAGKPHVGSLSDNLLDELELLDRLPRYIVDRMRVHSRIVEPWERINPYARWQKHSDPLLKELEELGEIRNSSEFPIQMEKLFTRISTGDDQPGIRFLVFQRVLSLTSSMGDDFSFKLLPSVETAIQEIDRNPSPELDMVQWIFLEQALRFVLQFDQRDQLPGLSKLIAKRFQAILTKRLQDPFHFPIQEGHLVRQCVQSLCRFELRDQLQQFLSSIEEELVQGRKLGEFRTEYRRTWFDILSVLLPIAGGRQYLGEPEPSIDWMNEARTVLSNHDLLFKTKRYPSYVHLAQTYIHTLSYWPHSEMLARIEELFPSLAKLPNTYVTATHYSRFHLNIVEEVVFSLIRVIEGETGDIPHYRSME